jgi:exopolyphosphatase/guanosine-5'-triphosphate,3'-diphosphate pyrophosphatase
VANLVSTNRPECVGVLDLGSNTVLLLVLDQGGRVRGEASRITRLGAGVFETGVLSGAARERTLAAVEEFAQKARALGAERLVAVGTEALRRAGDGESFLAELMVRADLDGALLLAGEEEAELAIEAARRSADADARPLTVVDVGGGSTELAWIDEGGARGISLPVGAVRLTEALVSAHPISEAELQEIRGAVRALAASVPGPEVGGPSGAGAVVAVAGTATTLAALDLALEPYDGERVEGYRLTRGRLGHWIAHLAALSVEERRALPGLEPGRADVIVAGALILDETLARLGAPAFDVSERGVRHGAALKLLAGDSPV